jgi:hypothetical protein
LRTSCSTIFSIVARSSSSGSGKIERPGVLLHLPVQVEHRRPALVEVSADARMQHILAVELLDDPLLDRPQLAAKSR